MKLVLIGPQLAFDNCGIRAPTMLVLEYLCLYASFCIDTNSIGGNPEMQIGISAQATGTLKIYD